MKYYKVSCFINGVEDNIRATKSTKLSEVEERLGSWLTEISERVFQKVRTQVEKDRQEFIRPSQEKFFNSEVEIDTIDQFRKNLDITICGTPRTQQTELFEHSKQLNKYLKSYYSEG